MEVLEHIVKYDKVTDIFKLYMIADIHRGNSGHDRKALLKDIELIKNDPNALWIGGGDYCMPLDAEILTKYGFKKYSELIVDEELICYN